MFGSDSYIWLILLIIVFSVVNRDNQSRPSSCSNNTNFTLGNLNTGI